MVSKIIYTILPDNVSQRTGIGILYFSTCSMIVIFPYVVEIHLLDLLLPVVQHRQSTKKRITI